MCIGESGSDTLQAAEVNMLKEAAGRSLPSYDCSLHSNDDAITWAVLSSKRVGPQMPRFTICRIDPCIMVMVEDRAERRFSSAPCIEAAIEFACQTALSAVLAINNVHHLPEMAQ